MRVWKKTFCLALMLSVLLTLCVWQAASAESGQISGMVWVEKTADGFLGSGESGLSGVKIMLEKKDENGQMSLAASTVSAKTGDFFFASLAAGEYRLRFEAPKEYHFTRFGDGSAVLPAQGCIGSTPFFTLGEGESLNKSAGVTRSACSVSLIAFEDLNANGGRMQSEPLIRSLPVEVVFDYEGETYLVASGATDRDGEALFRDLSPATYRVRVTLPQNFVIGPLGQKINLFYNCILPSEDQIGYSAPFTLDAKEGVSMGIGVVRTGSLIGSVWFDANYNGLWDADEGGLTDAVITLYSPSLDLSRTTQAGADGQYSFTGVQPGEYSLSFQLPDGMIFTYPGVSMLSETADQASMNVGVQVDVTTSLGPVGAMPAAKMALSLYQDENLNGVRDEGEAPLSGASVAVSQSGKTVARTTTNEEGDAVFHALRSGETKLAISLPEGYVFSQDQENLIPLSGARSEAEAAVTLDGAEPEARFAAAVTVPGALSGQVFEDSANTGVYEAGSPMLSAFTVQAVAADGQIVQETVTGQDGAYTLYPLYPGDYQVRLLLRDAYVASTTAPTNGEIVNTIVTQTPDYGETDPVSLAPGQRISTLNAGVFRAGLVNGKVLLDAAYAPTGGLSGVTATLLDASGAPYSDYSYGVTDENGDFSIKGVVPGTYSVRYTLPDNGRFTGSDGDKDTVISPSFVTESGSEIQLDPLYGVYTATLSGTIYHADTGDDAPFSALLTLTGQTLKQTFELTADPSGAYAFTGLMPDTYTLTVVLPEKLVFGQFEGAPVPAVAANSASGEITLAMGEEITGASMMAALPASIAGRVFYDDNLSGAQEEGESAAEGRLLSLYLNGEAVLEGETDMEGAFLFDRLVPGNYELRVALEENEELVQVDQAVPGQAYWSLFLTLRGDEEMVLPIMRYASVSGQVWSLDGGKNGVNGLSVFLLNEEGEEIAMEETNEEGAYSFTSLLPGVYSFSTVLPQGYLFAREADTDARSSYILSLPDGAPSAVPFTVPMGDDLSGMDIGIGANGRIGDRAWLDVNGNGMQDMGEPDMPGIQIALYQQDQLIVSTVTDVYGRYLLEDVYPGEYEMRVTMHEEIKTTVHQTDFPLVGSILPESDELTVSVPGVIVPSGGENLHCDLGFQLRKKNVYPAAMNEIPLKNWTPYAERTGEGQ